MNQFGKLKKSESINKDETPESALKKHFVFLEKSGVTECFAALLSPKYMASSKTCTSVFKRPYLESYGVIGTPKDNFYQKKPIIDVTSPPPAADVSTFPNFALVKVSCPTFSLNLHTTIDCLYSIK